LKTIVSRDKSTIRKPMSSMASQQFIIKIKHLLFAPPINDKTETNSLQKERNVQICC